MNIDQETLQRIAHLARLEFDDADAEKMMKDMTAMVNFVEKLKEVDTTGVEPLTTMSQEINSLRPDEVKPPISREQALSSAPQKDETYFRVPKVLE